MHLRRIQLNYFSKILQISNRNGAPVKNEQQIQNRASDPLPIIVRQLQTSGKQKGAAGSSKPPTSFKRQIVWFAAILLGGGAYIFYRNSKGKVDSAFQDGATPTKFKKRKFY